MCLPQVVEGQADETTEGSYTHTEQHNYTPQTTYMQQGYMPMQPPLHAYERPVDHFDITGAATPHTCIS